MDRAEDFIATVSSIDENARLIEYFRKDGLPDCYLTAGCLFQPIWNRRSNKSDLWGVKDFDVFYFDYDTSWEAENEVIERANKTLGSSAKRVEIRNQARVHLWYEKRFGVPSPELRNSRDGIDRFLISCTCVGIDVQTLELYAPNGLDELYYGKLRMNPRNSNPHLYRQKALDYKARWPWLIVT